MPVCRTSKSIHVILAIFRALQLDFEAKIQYQGDVRGFAGMVVLQAHGAVHG